MIHFCPWCAYLTIRFNPDSDIPQLYSMDIIVDLLQDRKLHIEPTAVGYFGGISHRRANMFPEGTGDFNLDYDSYRRILDGIDGLQVVDIPRYCCRVADWAIWQYAQERGLDNIVTPCPSCYGRLMRRAPEGMRVLHMAQFLLTVVDPKRTCS